MNNTTISYFISQQINNYRNKQLKIYSHLSRMISDLNNYSHVISGDLYDKYIKEVLNSIQDDGIFYGYINNYISTLSTSKNASIIYNHIDYQIEILKQDIQTIICDFLDVDKIYLYMNENKILSDNEVEVMTSKISRLLDGEPLAYIIGYKYFWEQKLKVTKNTLIPRADTELLVESVLTDIKNKNSKLRILDLGTGTGAIAIALASELPDSEVVAVDISTLALEVAKTNAHRNKVFNITFIQSKWYKSLINQKFNIIVSNPPYINYNDANIHDKVKQYEPSLALFSTQNGLFDIKNIITQAKSFLYKNATIHIEHGFMQSEDVKNIFKASGFINIQTLQDLNNKDRCTKAKIN